MKEIKVKKLSTIDIHQYIINKKRNRINGFTNTGVPLTHFFRRARINVTISKLFFGKNEWYVLLVEDQKKFVGQHHVPFETRHTIQSTRLPTELGQASCQESAPTRSAPKG